MASGAILSVARVIIIRPSESFSNFPGLRPSSIIDCFSLNEISAESNLGTEEAYFLILFSRALRTNCSVLGSLNASTASSVGIT